MRNPSIPALVALTLVAGCARSGKADVAEKPPETRWRTVATAADRDRLRDWRKSWLTALEKARAIDAPAVAAQGALFEPDQALPTAMPPVGDYRCRAFKLGSQPPFTADFRARPWAKCRVGREGDMPVLEKLDGAQRPAGKLYTDTDARAIFLGTLKLGDETIALPYGQDAKRDVAGYLERVGTTRWRLVLPAPSFESDLDVIELVPA
ncbi:DUF4893 domain-containing protein [Sphingomonas sp.]|uniref:DUF4893 domain-containing protein n=1 Tax=Sphingomonas sp. TaxID=28214 RepID=UPI001EB1582E|nr:DUF4893 domain-containing protein [Sphingomonas sp.]MBX3594870.1 DUF4893 domain-containing protein [Sphingomonas sp.]